MRVSATDIDDGNNSVVYYSLSPKRAEDGVYFRIDRNTGVIFLNKTIDVSIAGWRDRCFNWNAIAIDDQRCNFCREIRTTSLA